MLFHSDEHRYQVLSRLSLISLYILLACNSIIVVIGYFISKSRSISEPASPLPREILFILVIAEMIATYLVRFQMLKRVLKMGIDRPSLDDTILYKALLNITITVAAMCSIIPVYGLILIFLGEKFEVLILFAAISLIGYQFFRLRPKDFEEKG